MYGIIFFEIAGFALFVAVVASRLGARQYRDAARVVSAGAFGVLLEYMDVVLFSAYTYSPHFLIQVGPSPHNIPICVGLYWGVILHAAMQLSDAYGLPEWSRPFADALLALSIDLSIDAIAIRLAGGFWTWTGVPLEPSPSLNSFFGVHYGNFVGWFFVALIFSWLMRIEHRLLGSRLRCAPIVSAVFFVISPALAYGLLYAAIIGSTYPVRLVALLFPGLGIGRDLQVLCIGALAYLVTIAVVVQLVALRKRNAVRSRLHWSATTVFAFFHVSFLAFYLASGSTAQAPLVLPLGVAMALFAVVVHIPLLVSQRTCVVAIEDHLQSARD